MTLISVYVPKNRREALATVDTAMSAGGAYHGETSKYMIMGHVRALLLGRGSMRMFGLVCDDVNHSNFRTLDDLATYLPTLIRSAASRHIGQLGQLAGALAPELALVGWSAARRGYAAFWYTGANQFAPVAQQPGLRPTPAPPGYHIPPRAGDLTDAELVAVAECQMAQTRVDHGDPGRLGSGGRLVKIRLGPDGAIAIRVIHELSSTPPDQATAARYVATVRELLAVPA